MSGFESDGPPRLEGPRPYDPGSSPRRRTTLVGGAALAAVLVFAGYAHGAIESRRAGWFSEMRLARVQRVIRTALDSVGATAVQEDKIHDIVSAGATSLAADPMDRGAIRRRMLDLLKAPTVDRAAVEKLRQEQIARIDAKSRIVVGMVLDAAEQLTPAQRSQLADRAEAMGGQGFRDRGRFGDQNEGASEDDLHRGRQGAGAPGEESGRKPDAD